MAVVMVNPFRFAQAGVSPDEISNLELWLDAQDETTITLDMSSGVTTWDDKSSNEHTATASTSGAGTPSVLAVGGTNMISFTPGNQNHFVIPDHASLDPGTSQFTIFVVYRADGDTSRKALIYKEAAAGGFNPGYEVFIRHVSPPSDGEIGVAFMDNADLVFDAATDHNFSDDTKRGFVVVRDSGGDYDHYELLASGKVELDSSPLEGTAVGDISSAGDLYIGSRDPAGSNDSFMDGEIGEVLLYSKGLSDTEINNINSYLAAKWGL